MWPADETRPGEEGGRARKKPLTYQERRPRAKRLRWSKGKRTDIAKMAGLYVKEQLG